MFLLHVLFLREICVWFFEFWHVKMLLVLYCFMSLLCSYLAEMFLTRKPLATVTVLKSECQ